MEVFVAYMSLSKFLLVGMHLMNKTDAVRVKDSIVSHIKNNDKLRYDNFVVLNTVYVDRLRVLDLYTMTVYDLDAHDAIKNNTDILGFKHFSFGIDDKYITVNAGGLKYHNGDNSSSVALFYNNEVLIDFEKYNSSNIFRYEFNKSYHYGMGLNIYVDAETGKVAVCFNNEHLIYGDKDLINSYNSAKSNIKYTVYMNYYKHTINELMPKICSKISDNAYMLYNGAVLLGCYSEDIEYNSFDDIVVPDGVTDVYFGYSDIEDRINYFVLPKSIKNVYSLDFFAPPSKLAFTLDKSVSLDIIKSLHKICLFGIGDLESKEDAITALKSGGVVINLV